MHATSICVGILFNTLVLISSFYIFHWFNIFSVFLKIIKPLISSVQLLSRVWPFATPMDCSMPDFPVHHQLPELTQTHVHHVGDATQPLILCHPLLLKNLPVIWQFKNQNYELIFFLFSKNNWYTSVINYLNCVFNEYTISVCWGL